MQSQIKELAGEENVNNHSHICQECWQELHNFHHFYINIESAHKNYNAIVKSEIISDVSSNEVDLSEQVFLDSEENSLPESEFLWITEKNPLETSEQKDVNGESGVEKKAKRKRPVKKNANDTKSIAETNKPEDNKNQDEIGINLKEVEKEDVEKVSSLEKRTKRKRPVRKTTKGMKNIGSIEINKLESDKIQDEVGKKLKEVDKEDMEKVTSLEKSTKRKRPVRKSTKDKKNIGATEINKPDANKTQDEVGIKLNAIKNDSKKDKLRDVNFSDQNDNSESDKDSSSNSAHLSKVEEELHKEEDKFIAENFAIICCLCDMPLASYDIMVTHYNEEHNQRGYATCCDQKLHTREKIVDHIKFHLDPESFKCEQCNKITTGRQALKMHIKYVHESEKVECDICGKILANKSNLKGHKLIHETDNSKKVSCNECGKIYNSKHSLFHHMRLVHLKKYIICDLCGKSVSDKSRLNLHIMLEHKGEKREKLSCKVCGRILSSMSCLTRHMRNTHPPNGLPELYCPVCNKKFTAHINLKGHIRKVHENKYARKCTLCEKEFKSPGALKDHMSFHTGQPLHVCPFCSKTFHSSGNMHGHRKREHPKELEEYLKKFYVNLPEKNTTKTTES